MASAMTVISSGQNEIVVGISDLTEMQGCRIEWLYSDDWANFKLHGETRFTLSEESVQYSYNGLKEATNYRLKCIFYKPMADGTEKAFYITEVRMSTKGSLGDLDVVSRGIHELGLRLKLRNDIVQRGYILKGYATSGTDYVEIQFPRTLGAVVDFNITGLKANTIYKVEINIEDLSYNRLGVLKIYPLTQMGAHEAPDFKVFKISNPALDYYSFALIVKSQPKDDCLIKVYAKENGIEQLVYEKTATLNKTEGHDYFYFGFDHDFGNPPIDFRIEVWENGHMKEAKYTYYGEYFSWAYNYGKEPMSYLDVNRWQWLFQVQERAYDYYGLTIPPAYIPASDLEGKPLSARDFNSLVFNQNVISFHADTMSRMAEVAEGDLVTIELFWALTDGMPEFLR